jgi:hypothetical protein
MGARPCGSCGEPGITEIKIHGRPMPTCLRHYSHWRTPGPDYTCPTACVESNHPGREHAAWLTEMWTAPRAALTTDPSEGESRE